MNSQTDPGQARSPAGETCDYLQRPHLTCTSVPRGGDLETAAPLASSPAEGGQDWDLLSLGLGMGVMTFLVQNC